MKRPLAQRAEYALVQLLSAILKRSSQQQVERWSSHLAAGAERLFHSRTEMARRNVRRVFPEMSEFDAAVLVRKCWKHFAETALEFLRTTDEPMDHIAGRFDISGWNHAEEVLALGRGAIVVTAHFGSWEFGVSIVSQLEQKVTIVARALDNELLHDKVLKARERSNVEFVDRRRAARSLVKTLQERGIVILVADQAVQPREGVLVPFLGRPAWSTSAPARLSLKFGAPILCVFCLPAGERFALEIEPPIVPDYLPPQERTAEAITARMNDIISAQILRHPELWLWMHNRWKNANYAEMRR